MRNYKKKETMGSSEDPSLVNDVDELGLVYYGLNPRPVPVGFVVDRVALGHVLFQLLKCPNVSFILPLFHTGSFSSH